MTSRLRFVLSASVIALVCDASVARAQLPTTRLQSVFPAGAERGESVVVNVRGTEVGGVSGLWFDHPGLRAFHLKGTSFRVVAATTVPAGPHDVRAIGPLGVSNPRVFVVGDSPESNEVEPNDTPDQANPLALNRVVNGEIAASPDVDCYAFEGKKGRRVRIDLTAARLESRLDATIRLYGPGNVELAESRDDHGGDPFLDVVPPADGRYVVKVRDVVFGGSPEHVYRLELTDRPMLDALVPVSAAPGARTTFTLMGRGLTSAAESSKKGSLLETLTVTIDVPAAAGGWAATGAGALLVPASEASRRGFPYAFVKDGRASNALFVAVARDAVVVEREPNDAPGAQAVVPPCEISGSFGVPGDVDAYRFAAKKGEVWRVEAEAERLGSAADPVFTVERVDADGTRHEVASAEDAPDPAGTPNFNQSSVDAGLRWVVSDDGVYQVVASDLYSSQRGDPRLFYRLRIRREKPDFDLFATPTNVTLPEGIVVGAGGRAGMTVIARRIDGHARPIRVEAVDLPPGVRSEPVVIAANQTRATLVLSADAGAPPLVGPFRVWGRELASDRKETLDFQRGGARAASEIEREAVPAGLTSPSVNNQPGAVRVDRGLMLAVRPIAAYRVTAAPSILSAAKGEAVEARVEVERLPGFDAAVQVVGDFPANFASEAATIDVAAGKTSGVLRFKVNPNTPAGLYSFVLRGNAPVRFSVDPAAKDKPTFNVSEPSNALTIQVR